MAQTYAAFMKSRAKKLNLSKFYSEAAERDEQMAVKKLKKLDPGATRAKKKQGTWIVDPGAAYLKSGDEEMMAVVKKPKKKKVKKN